MQVIKLLRHVPDTTEDHEVLPVDIRRVTAALERDLAFGLNFNPLFVSNIENPEVVELLRAVILASEDVHVSTVDRS